ncbi:hypothetical protein TSUD_366220 [Trifolium subterraneum]|uniref:ADP-ribosyl cyclase/cyclic ADP-ribose hydrolase n=1 Tax=Trifolium subterraneum TaxID=3900 RepID=A0A2Z6P2C4_TRISU|nr:hypothetical protein TSUD_366220 [Trifolium subterraneum]
MASSINSTALALTLPKKRKNYYDVFVTYRGEDTRNNITDFLFDALEDKAVSVFRDDTNLPKGESIGPELLRAIEDSHIFVVIFSKNYASSTWCLQELEKICECVQVCGKHILPVFYDVDPSEVRKQSGIFGEEFVKHEKRFQHDYEMVQRWRKALTQVGKISGWDVRHNMTEINFESLNLDEEEELNFVVGEDTHEQHDLNLCLVGRFVHDRPIRFNSIKACLADVWRPVKGMTVKEATQGLYLFKFFHPLDVEEVLKGGPWTFDSFTLIIDRLKIGVALQDVPIGMMLETVGRGIANYIGEFVEYDKNNNTSFWRKYMRVKVRVDVRSPLKIEKKIKLNGGKGGAVKFKYEKLGLFCFVCGRLGHAENKCEVKYAMERDDGRKSWSNEIKAEVRRPGGRVGSRWLHEEGRNMADVDASNTLGERGSQHTGPAQTSVASPRESRGPENGGIMSTVRGHSPPLRPAAVRQSSSNQGSFIEAPTVPLISNRPILAINNVNTTTAQLTTSLALNEGNQLDPDDMDTQVERKRRRAACLVAEGSEVRTNQHFLSAAIDVEGRSGGLAVFWKDSSKCRVLNYTRNFINLLVEDEQCGEWRLTCYYGYPERSRRRAAWDLLRALGNMSSIPWCIIGDFNDLLSQADKKGIHPHPNGLCMGFRQAVSDCDLTDIPIEGHQFTWIKSRGTPHVIEERLDRAMASTSWLQLFPQVRLTNLLASYSDHSPILLQWLGGRENLEVIDRVTRCANKLQRWGKKKRIRFKEEIDECVRRMNELRGNQDEEGSIQYQELSERHATLLIQEEGYWKQRAKMHWLQEGDMNTRFFHMSATVRSKKNVTKLIADNGTEAHTQEELCEVAKSYFDTLFKPRDEDHDPVLNLIQPRVTDDDNLVLTAPITKVEIHAASTWLERGYFPTSLNDTNICLIPKCDNPTSMKDLRPISLCNVLYKMISKVLANRLKCCLDKCVSQEQSTFVEGRSILDNALIATEVIHALKRKTTGRRGELALKIDISKAYDKVDWVFLRGVMTRMGFTDVWIRSRIATRGDLHGVGICRGAPEVSHLLFADDCFLFCRASVAEVNELMGILHTYETASGQEVNLVKSEVFISRNMSQAAKEDLSRILGVKLVLGTGIYLGLPSMVGRSRQGNHDKVSSAGNTLICNEWRIGSGDNICVMHDPWLCGSANRWVPSPQPEGVYQLSVRDLLHDNYKAWNIVKVRNLFSRDVAEKILETPLVSSVREDKVVWDEERNECYSVKSGYKLAMRYLIGSDKYHVMGNWNGIWKVQAPHKACHLLWRLCRGCLPTRSRLLERRVEFTLNCPVCDEEIEDELHIFFRCAVARDSWSAAGLSSVLHNATYQQTNAMDRIFAICSNESSDIVGRVAMLLWCIWQNRNDKLWNDNVQMPRQIGRHAFDAWNDWYSVHKLQSNNVSGTTEADLVRWEKPTLDWVKCNVDVAFVSGSGRTSMGLCFRDNSGHFMAGMTQ